MCQRASIFVAMLDHIDFGSSLVASGRRSLPNLHIQGSRFDLRTNDLQGFPDCSPFYLAVSGAFALHLGIHHRISKRP